MGLFHSQKSDVPQNKDIDLRKNNSINTRPISTPPNINPSTPIPIPANSFSYKILNKRSSPIPIPKSNSWSPDKRTIYITPRKKYSRSSG